MTSTSNIHILSAIKQLLPDAEIRHQPQHAAQILTNYENTYQYKTYDMLKLLQKMPHIDVCSHIQITESKLMDWYMQYRLFIRHRGNLNDL